MVPESITHELAMVVPKTFKLIGNENYLNMPMSMYLKASQDY